MTTTNTQDNFDIEFTTEPFKDSDFTPADIPSLEKHLKDVQDELSLVNEQIAQLESIE
jgi:hypothetical protein